MNARFKIALMLLLLPAALMANEGKEQFKRTIEKSYPVGDGVAISVSNKYGKVILHTWNKKEVKATIVITGFGKNSDESKSITDAVDVVTSNTESAVSFQTNYLSGGRNWLSWSGKKDSKDYVNIDYELYVPSSVGQLAVVNNFGDVIADDLPCAVKLNLNYCYYDIHSVSGTLDLNMNYCSKGKIGKAANVRVRANYSTIKLDAANVIDAKSNYCEYEMDNVSEFLVSSNYDDYKIGKLGRLQASATYSDFKIGSLTQDASLKLTYSDVVIKDLAPSFKGLDAKGTYSDVKLTLSDRLDVKLDADLNHGDVHTGGIKMSNVNTVEKSGHVTYTGATSGNCQQCPTIKMEGVYSDISINNK